MKKLLFVLVLFGLSFSTPSCAQRNFAAKKLLFSQVQNPYINYGYLYNKNILSNALLLPSGYSIITTAQMNTIITSLGGISSTTAFKMMRLGTAYWTIANGNNSSLFGAVGSGDRNYTGGFSAIRSTWLIWVNTGGPSYYDYWQITVTGTISRNLTNVVYGFGLRLVKNTTTLSNGQMSTMTGNDDKIYKTICIAGIEIMTDNLAETKYNDGSWISGFDGGVYTPISNADWASREAAGESMMCVYNDDKNNR